ncbi:acyl carrier protein [Actinoplanes sp. ATCC 53533]|uniref:phosphopantetheine-binding protein n=1 Tax=Actinoplanes sp. ATCC 53533 TaxID=1288362 RepID=UPI000F78E9C9|nr:phosphopantetheine-binding protein [Actinoplanes sp. ATCC 53533]RSM57996.1 acyl carrier protein [Actinoplanes sp. ATCC 53533]
MPAYQPSVADTVRSLVTKQLNLNGYSQDLRPDDNLWSLGMTSLTCLGLMLSIEDTFEIELPEEALKEATFRSISTISAAVESSRKQARVRG